LRTKWPTSIQTAQFRPILAHSASTVTACKKVQLPLIWSWPRALQRAIDEPCTLPLSPPKGGTKRDIAVCASKIQLLSKKVWYKVSLCENFQRQSCSYIIPLSNGPQIDCGRLSHLSVIGVQSDAPLHKTPISKAFVFKIVLQPWQLARTLSATEI